jgi:hypothetical protein
MKTKSYIAVIILAVIALQPLYAEVFRLGRGNQTLDGKSVYRSQVNINGGQGELEATSYDGAFDEVISSIKSNYKGKAFILHGGNGIAIGLVVSGRQATRLLVSRVDELNSKCIVFTIKQDIEDYRLSTHAPTHHLISEIPAFANSTPTFYMKDESTHMQLAVSSSSSSPTAVHMELSASLASNGWQPAFPLSAARDTPGLMLYMRDREVCCIAVNSSPGLMGTSITMLHKEPAVQ